MPASYRFDVHYRLKDGFKDGFYLDETIMNAVGRKCGSAGSGMRSGCRDMQFYFRTFAKREAFADKLSARNIEGVEVVRRYDLDGLDDPHAAMDANN